MRNHLASYAYSCCFSSCCCGSGAGWGNPCNLPAMPYLNWDGARGRGHGDAAPSIYSGSVQVGHSFALVNTFMLLLSTSAPGAGYVPVPQVPPVPHPACCCFSLVLCLRLVQLACCLSCWQLCSFNNLLGTLSRRTGQAARFWSGEGR